MRSLLWFLVAAVVGCASEPVLLPKVPPLVVRTTYPRDERPFGTLYRDEVATAVRAGLGHFLQRVDVRPVTRPDDSGRVEFVGFEILALRPAADWLRFDFVPGDIVTRIDGAAVEHYNTVIPTFEGLVSKDRFMVELLRAGEPKTVVVTIANRSAAMPAKAASGSRAEASAGAR